MANNDILRSIRDALQLDETTMLKIFSEAGREVGQAALAAFLKTADEDDYIPCANPIMGFFLDGLIIHKRGRQGEGPVTAAPPLVELGNNAILKKLRIALDLKEDDMVGIFKLAGVAITKHELTALFRKQGHKHYKACTDELLQSFIEGVARRTKA